MYKTKKMISKFYILVLVNDIQNVIKNFIKKKILSLIYLQFLRKIIIIIIIIIYDFRAYHK